MKVGFVLECTRDGADVKVISHVLKRLKTEQDVAIDPCFRTMGNKRFLFEKCAATVEGLFDDERCDRVFVVWDLHPCNAEFQQNGTPCHVLERDSLRDQLRLKDQPRTSFVCIRRMLETWLIADAGAVTGAVEALMSNHKDKVKRFSKVSRPETERDPKARLMDYFDQNTHRDYVEAVHALRIAENADLEKWRKVRSFDRLWTRLGGT